MDTRVRSGTAYARQFVGGPEPLELPASVTEEFERQRFGSLTVAIHPLAPATRVVVAGRELLCIGHILDPRYPALDNAAVLAHLLQRSESFARLEEAIGHLGGRWLLFARIDGDRRLYPDAGGLKAAFYTMTERGIAIASQPSLLHPSRAASPPHATIEKLWQSPGAAAWPAALTPYAGVRQLLPNHYLDLDTARVHRFWPTSPVARIECDEAARSIRALLAGTFRAVRARGVPVALPLTGGIDSRTLLSCATDILDDVTCFTILDTKTPLHEAWIPPQLAFRMGVKFRFVWAPATSASLADLLRRTTGSMWRDQNENRAVGFGRTDAPFTVVGHVSEVCRCYYYKHGEHPETVGGARLAEIAGWGTDAEAVLAFDEWMSGIPHSMNINLLDLFYWESRLGNWAALDYLVMEAFADVLSPFNCRELLSIGLGVDVAYRRAPYELHRRICAIGAPELLDIPVNATWMDTVPDRLRGLVPRELKSAVRRAIRR